MLGVLPLDPEYLISSADPGQYDRLQAAVRKPAACRDHCTGDPGDADQYGGGGYLLQSEGSEKQLPERCKIILKYEALHAKTDSSFYIFRAVIDKEAFFRMQ